MHYIMLNPMYNIESNALLNVLTNDVYRRGGLTLNFIFFLSKYLSNCIVFVTIINNVHTLISQRKIHLKLSAMASNVNIRLFYPS